MLEQSKIDWAVLYKLFQHAEFNGEAIPPVDVANLFKVNIAVRRVEIALRELESKGDVVNEYHPHYFDEGLWQITRAGIEKIERLIKSESTFVGRLHRKGDDWLQTDEAEKAKLSTGRVSPKGEGHVPAANTIIGEMRETREAERARRIARGGSIDWTKWGTILAAVGILVSILIAVFS